MGCGGSWNLGNRGVEPVVKMPQGFDFVDWWNKEAHRGGGTPVVVKMENPNYDMVEIESPKFKREKDKGKNAKQLMWVWQLRAQKAAGSVAWVWSGVMTLLSALKKRLIYGEGMAPRHHHKTLSSSHKGTLFKAITGFLVFAVIMLCVEVGAHALGWHFTGPPSFSLQSIPHAMYLGWMYFRANYIAPTLQRLTNFCIWLFLIQSADRLILCFGCAYIWCKGIKPIPRNPSLESDDIEQPDKGHPMCLVQIPMCNEREVCLFSHSHHLLPLLLQCEWNVLDQLAQWPTDGDLCFRSEYNYCRCIPELPYHGSSDNPGILTDSRVKPGAI